jgi:hypothetical protein
MSLKEATYYTVICDWPDCGVSVDEDGDYSAWADKQQALDAATDDNWRESRDGQKHYCEAHPAVWASDYENGEPFPEPPYLLIHDGDTGDTADDGKVTFVGAT